MPRATTPDPLLQTPADEHNKVEVFKRDNRGYHGDLDQQYRDLQQDDVSAAAEQLSKSHGIYLEYNRAKTGREKDWMYMVRISVRGGGTLNRQQWAILDDAASDLGDNNPHGGASIRLTNRQNIQYHWVKKKDVIELIQRIARTGFFTMNGCGDNTRNVMACPLSAFSGVYDANAKAHQYGTYFQLPSAPHAQIFAIDPNLVRDEGPKYDYGPQLLNRKFKIAFSALSPDPQTGELIGDNCVEMRTHDMGIAPILNGGGKVDAYQVYVGGGQGEKNGKPTFARLSEPLGIFTEAHLMQGLHDIVKVHEEWGDRKNRHWARLKYVVHKQGIDWYRRQVREKGAVFEDPDTGFDPGPRMMHHGWHTLPDDGPREDMRGKLAYGAYIECGRLVDSEEGDDPEHQSGNVTGNGRLKTMVRETLDAFDGVELMITPNQDLLFVGIDPAAKDDFEAKLVSYGHGKRRGKAYSTLRVLSGACVGLPTCRLSYTDSEQFEPELITKLEEMGYGDVGESIGITGCERQCFRPATKSVGWVGQGPDMYALKLGGSEDGRHQGTALVRDGKWYLRQVSRDDVPKVTAALIDHWQANRSNGEDLGAFNRRVGVDAILDFLGSREDTKATLEKTAPAPYLPDGVMSTGGAAVPLGG